MKKFVFELEQLLNLRKYEQDQAQIELGKAVQVEQHIQDGLDTLAQQYVATKKMTSGQSDFVALAKTQQFYNFIKQQQEKLMRDMASAKIVTEEKRALFNAAMQKHESLKKLKERQFAIFKEEQKKAEAKALDDIVTSKYN
ncbi:MAG: flagellar export protein FliJ [Treponema sp.]|nr:flagellar export protein FliJ [Treponema sp.]MEE3434229.1 flagellar export protein FliJ [Treponema sp.]